jgi:hypothetical protein
MIHRGKPAWSVIVAAALVAGPPAAAAPTRTAALVCGEDGERELRTNMSRGLCGIWAGSGRTAGYPRKTIVGAEPWSPQPAETRYLPDLSRRKVGR